MYHVLYGNKDLVYIVQIVIAKIDKFLHYVIVDTKIHTNNSYYTKIITL